MCHRCDYPHLLESARVELTPRRLQVLEIVGGSRGPLSARKIFETLSENIAINRVTVYRILDLLVAHGLLVRLSGSRGLLYGLAPNENHPAHPHFFCRLCGRLECLDAGCLDLDMAGVQRTFGGWIENVQVRLEGICQNCLPSDKASLQPKRAAKMNS